MDKGRYDQYAEFVRDDSNAAAVLLLVLEGRQGSGFSVVSRSRAMADALPAMLRRLADEVDANLAMLKGN